MRPLYLVIGALALGALALVRAAFASDPPQWDMVALAVLALVFATVPLGRMRR